MSAEFKGSDDFPVLLLRRQVAFPRVVVRVLVGRKRSLALLKHLQKQGKVGQKQPTFAAVTAHASISERSAYPTHPQHPQATEELEKMQRQCITLAMSSQLRS